MKTLFVMPTKRLSECVSWKSKPLFSPKSSYSCIFKTSLWAMPTRIQHFLMSIPRLPWQKSMGRHTSLWWNKNTKRCMGLVFTIYFIETTTPGDVVSQLALLYKFLSSIITKYFYKDFCFEFHRTVIKTILHLKSID